VGNRVWTREIFKKRKVEGKTMSGNGDALI